MKEKYNLHYHEDWKEVVSTMDVVSWLELAFKVCFLLSSLGVRDSN